MLILLLSIPENDASKIENVVLHWALSDDFNTIHLVDAGWNANAMDNGGFMPRRRMDIELTTPDLVILSFLMENPMHGYQIALALKERQVKDWAGVSKPQVYYSLKKLEASGLICGKSDEGYSLGPERRIFSITQGACSALADALDSDKWAISRPVPPFSTWAMLSVYAKKQTVKRILEQRREFLRNEIARELKTLDDLPVTNDKSSQVVRAMISLAIKNFELELSWLDEFESLRTFGTELGEQ
jgi:DNA-binding PadR family transcriptional regulator